MFTRRRLLKTSGAALGGLAVGATVNVFADKKTQPTDGCIACGCPTGKCSYPPEYEDTQKYTYFNELEPWKPTDGDPYNGIPETYTPPAKNEMRITFLGSCIPNQLRRAQQMMSIFVEVGPTRETEPDQFVFDCGSGVCTNYNTMGISLGRMDKIFLTHLHGDHISDLIHIYCSVPGIGGPFFVWGRPSVKSPRPAPPLRRRRQSLLRKSAGGLPLALREPKLHIDQL
jgi:ribonuclease Z